MCMFGCVLGFIFVWVGSIFVGDDVLDFDELMYDLFWVVELFGVLVSKVV